MNFGYNQPSGFRGEVVGNCGRTTDDMLADRRTTEPAYTISIISEPSVSDGFSTNTQMS